MTCRESESESDKTEGVCSVFTALMLPVPALMVRSWAPLESWQMFATRSYFDEESWDSMLAPHSAAR